MVINKIFRYNLPGAIISKSIIAFFYYVRYRISSFISMDCSIKYLSQELNIMRIIYIKLDVLTHYLTKSIDNQEPLSGKDFFSAKFIQHGQWDTYLKPIIPDYYHQKHKRAVTFRSTYQLFKDCTPYQECDEYKKKLKGESGYDQASVEELDEKYKNLEILFNTIKMYGYKSQKELKTKPKHWNDEIKVAIDRNGRYIKIAESANHRLALAQILNVECIPVFIQGVHQDWAMSCYLKHGGHLLYAINKELSLMNQKKLRPRDETN